jgi:hypothetical protein
MNYKGQNKIIYQDDKIIKFLCESKKYGNQEAIIDSEDWDKIKNYHWSIANCYGFRIISSINGNKVFLSRFIMNCNNENMDVDHVFHDTLDNRKCNLRICTHSDNIKNRKLNCNNKFGFKGVSIDKKLIKNKSYIYYRARIQYNNKEKFLGYFKYPKQAAKAYNKAAIKYYGEFANINEGI